MTGEDFEMGGDSSRDVYMKYFRYTAKREDIRNSYIPTSYMQFLSKPLRQSKALTFAIFLFLLKYI